MTNSNDKSSPSPSTPASNPNAQGTPSTPAPQPYVQPEPRPAAPLADSVRKSQGE